MKTKFTRSLLSSALLLASTQVFANSAPIVPYGGGAFFYAWNANAYCDPTQGNCPEKWTDIIKNINAQVPSTADIAKLKYIYLDSITLNSSNFPPSSNLSLPFMVGGCNDPSASIQFCSTAGGLPYVKNGKNIIVGPAAVQALALALGSSPSNPYYIMPIVSDSFDDNLANLTQGQFQSLAFSLACIVNPSASNKNSGSGAANCRNVFMASLASNYSAQNISGLGFDIENPDLSGHHSDTPFADQSSATDFYTALQADISSNDSNPMIMISRGPGGLKETGTGTAYATTGDLLDALNTNSLSTKFIFSPQIYDLCDGMGNSTTSWACPVTTPFDSTPDGSAKNNYGEYTLFQPIPSAPIAGIDGVSSWDDETKSDIPFKDMSMSYLFKSEIMNKSLASSYPNVPVQLTISGGGSSQIWSRVNLYNINFADPTASSTSTAPDYYLAPVANYSSSAAVNFQPSMLYGDKQACQAENADGSIGATIPNCMSYNNPYGESVSSYATSLISTLQYTLTSNTSAPFYGLVMYPFTPYGYFDVNCPAKTAHRGMQCAGFLPEIPDGLVNGQKPVTSFWKTYIGQFANQAIGSSSKTASTNKEILLTLSNTPTPYYVLNAGAATINFQVSTYPSGGGTSAIQSYKANLIDATGHIVATGTANNSPIQINNAPGGNYTLEIQALDANGGVMTEVDAAANGGGTVPAPQIGLKNVNVFGAPTSTSYTLSWTLNCSSSATPPPGFSSATPPPGFLAVSQLYASGNSSPLTRITQWIGSPECGHTYQSTFSLSKGNFSTSATQASLILQEAGTFQNIAPPAYAPITIPSP